MRGMCAGAHSGIAMCCLRAARLKQALKGALACRSFPTTPGRWMLARNAHLPGQMCSELIHHNAWLQLSCSRCVLQASTSLEDFRQYGPAGHLELHNVVVRCLSFAESLDVPAPSGYLGFPGSPIEVRSLPTQSCCQALRPSCKPRAHPAPARKPCAAQEAMCCPGSHVLPRKPCAAQDPCWLSVHAQCE